MSFFFFIVIIDAASNLTNSSASASILSNCSLVIKSVPYNNSSQYIVSLASFCAIESLFMKSASLTPYIASAKLAPILVPHLSICYEITNSFFSSKRNLYNLIIRIANALLLSLKILSFIAYHKEMFITNECLSLITNKCLSLITHSSYFYKAWSQ